MRPVLLYDGECRVCRFTARAVVRLDRSRQLAVLPLQDAAAEHLLASLPTEERLATWRLARVDGSLAGYGSGVPGLLSAMRLTRPFGRALALVPAGALDAAYRFVARNRSNLGRFVPDGSAPKRFP
ncbi:MAG: DCC1-like thiol-disulfide oxidoreductase family protein [Gaiellaceae bacterium]